MAFFDGSPVITFQDAGRQYAVCAVRNVGAPAFRSGAGTSTADRWRKISPTIPVDAEYFRRRLQHTNLADLRQLLTRSGISCHSHDTAQIFRLVAESVGNGTFTLLERAGGAGAAPGVGRPKQENKELAEPLPNISPVDLIVNKPPKPPMSVRPASVDPQAQAAVLQEAARLGLPLCELCKQS